MLHYQILYYATLYHISERVHTLMLHLLDEFLQLHSKNDYFFWWFLNGLSHQTFEPLSRVDLDYYHFFKKHFDKG